MGLEAESASPSTATKGGQSTVESCALSTGEVMIRITDVSADLEDVRAICELRTRENFLCTGFPKRPIQQSFTRLIDVQLCQPDRRPSRTGVERLLRCLLHCGTAESTEGCSAEIAVPTTSELSWIRDTSEIIAGQSHLLVDADRLRQSIFMPFVSDLCLRAEKWYPVFSSLEIRAAGIATEKPILALICYHGYDSERTPEKTPCWSEQLTCLSLLQWQQSIAHNFASAGSSLHSALVYRTLDVALDSTCRMAERLVSVYTSDKRVKTSTLKAFLPEMDFTIQQLGDLFEFCQEISVCAVLPSQDCQHLRTRWIWFRMGQTRKALAYLASRSEAYGQHTKDAQSAKGTEAAIRLTTLATLFLPLSLATSILAMDRRFKDLGALFFDFVGLSTLLLTLAYLVWSVMRIFLNPGTGLRNRLGSTDRHLWREHGNLVRVAYRATRFLLPRVGLVVLLTSILIGMLNDPWDGMEVFGSGTLAELFTVIVIWLAIAALRIWTSEAIRDTMDDRADYLEETFDDLRSASRRLSFRDMKDRLLGNFGDTVERMIKEETDPFGRWGKSLLRRFRSRRDRDDSGEDGEAMTEQSIVPDAEAEQRTTADDEVQENGSISSSA